MKPAYFLFERSLWPNLIFFLVVEALLTLGLITIFNNDITSFIFILVWPLLAVRLFNKESKSDLCLDHLFDLTFHSWNIYGTWWFWWCIYVRINHFSTGQGKNATPHSIQGRRRILRLCEISGLELDGTCQWSLWLWWYQYHLPLGQMWLIWPRLSSRGEIMLWFCRNCMVRRLSWYQLMFPSSSIYQRFIALSPSSVEDEHTRYERLTL